MDSQSFFEKIKWFFYNLFKKYFKKYSVNYTVNAIHTYENNKLKIIIKNFNLKIYDNGIYLEHYGFFIRYEHILYIQNDNKFYTFYILGKMNENELVFSDSLLKFIVKINLNDNFINHINANMNYHIKYNNINTSFLEYYKKLKNKKIT